MDKPIGKTSKDDVAPWDEAPQDLKVKINRYYHKLLNSHPNMSRDRLLRACGKKFKVMLEVEQPMQERSPLQ